MHSWKQVSQAELEEIIKSQLLDCTPEQQKVFEQYRIPLRLAPIERYGVIETVFVVAQRGNDGDDTMMESWNLAPEPIGILGDWIGRFPTKEELWKRALSPLPTFLEWYRAWLDRSISDLEALKQKQANESIHQDLDPDGSKKES